MRATDIRLVHRGNFMCYYEIEYVDDDGNTKTYEMVSKSGSKILKLPDLTLETIGKSACAVVMLVFNRDKSKILLCKEFRMGVNDYVYNSPAGLIDDGEEAVDAVKRELKEETGLDLVRIIDKLEPTFTCAPVTDDVTQLFIVEAEGNIGESNSIYEEIHSKWYTKEEARQLLKNKETKFAGRLQAFVYMWANS